MNRRRLLITIGVTTVFFILLGFVGVWGLRAQRALDRERARHKSFCLKVENSLHEFGETVQRKKHYLGPLPDTLFRVAAKHCLPTEWHKHVDSRFDGALETQPEPNNPRVLFEETGIMVRGAAGILESQRTGHSKRAERPLSDR